MATLRASDFANRDGLDMWGALVEEAKNKKILPADVKADEVEEIEVEVMGVIR